MLKNIIVLSDGTEISSGTGSENAIKSCTITECVNDGEELSMGSACSSCVELSIIAPNGWLSVPDSFTLYKENDAGTRTKVGLFHAEKPVKSSANTYKITAFDNVSKLDKDISAWLKGLTGWPYTLTTFAGMVCKACGLSLVTKDLPNGTFPVRKFFKSGVTGREIMQWIGEVACRFCHADADGNIEFAWYKPLSMTIQSTGERYYFANSLSYEEYKVAPIDAVQIGLSDGDNGMPWPEKAEAQNPYMIHGNPLLLAQVDSALLPYLDVIQQELKSPASYHPCKVSIPACMDIRAGDAVQIIPKNGPPVTTYVMTKTQSGQRDTLECTGSKTRSSSTAASDRSPSKIAQQAVDRQSQRDVFNKLTNGGEVQGLFLGEDGNVYLNVTYAIAGVLQSKDGSTFYLDLENGILKMNASELKISGKTVEKIAKDAAGDKLDSQTQRDIFDKLTNNGQIQGIEIKDGKWYINAQVIGTGVLRSADGKTYFNLDTGVIRCEGEDSVVEMQGGKVDLYNKNGIKLISLTPHATAGGQLDIYDQNGEPTFGVFAYNGENHITCGGMTVIAGWNKLDDGRWVLGSKGG